MLATELADSVWQFSITTQNLPHAEAAALAAWWESLGGGMESFLAHDYRHPEMIAYPGG